jgi:hypothetical protein
MIASDPTSHPACWKLEALPGDGLIATSSHHLLVVEVDDDIAAGGPADEIVAAFDAHCRLVGRGAARSLRLAVATILAGCEHAPCAVALVSAWDDQLAVYLHGRAEALLIRAEEETWLSGQSSLVATDVVLINEFDELALHVGDRPDDNRAPVEVGEVIAGRGLRLQLQRSWDGGHPLNKWGPAR